MKKNFIKLFLVGFMMLSITACSNSSDSSDSSSTSETKNETTNNKEEKKTVEEIEKNITSNSVKGENGDLVIFVQNKNDVGVDCEIEAIFYSADGRRIGDDNVTLEAIKAKGEVATELYQTPSEYETYEVTIKSKQTTYASYLDDIKMTDKDTGEKVEVTVKNNSSKELWTTTVSVVYYRGETVVGCHYTTEYDLGAGKSATIDVKYPNDANNDIAQFDSYKVYLVEAFKSGFND